MNDVKMTDLTPCRMRLRRRQIELRLLSSTKPASCGGFRVEPLFRGRYKAETVSPAVIRQQAAGVDPAGEGSGKQSKPLNEYVQSVQRDLQFNLDDSSGKTVIQVLERAPRRSFCQIPDEVAIKLAHNLQSDEPLSLFNAKA